MSKEKWWDKEVSNLTEKQIEAVVITESKKPYFLEHIERAKKFARIEGFKQGQKAEVERRSKETPIPLEPLDELSELFVEHQNLADFLKKDRARTKLETENKLKQRFLLLLNNNDKEVQGE